MNDKVTVFAGIMCVLLCISMFNLGLSIPTVYYGFKDEDSTCQRGSRGGLDLSDWVKGAGLSSIIITGWVLVMSALAMIVEDLAPMFLLSTIGVLTADVFFWIIWVIWGIVILATNENNRCVAQGKGMAVMAIINIFLGEVRFIYLYFLGKQK